MTASTLAPATIPATTAPTIPAITPPTTPATAAATVPLYATAITTTMIAIIIKIIAMKMAAPKNSAIESTLSSQRKSIPTVFEEWPGPH